MTTFERADYARQLLDSAIWKLAYDDMHKAVMAKLETIAITDMEGQQAAIISLQCLKGLKSQLERYVQDGVNEASKEKAQTFIERTRETLDKRWGQLARRA